MNRLIIFCLAALCGWLGTACGEEASQEVPTERTTLMMDILTDMDMGKYTAALPKIRRYQVIDDTNPFLNELEALAVTNDCISRLRPLLEKRDYAAAEKLMKDLLTQYDARADRIELLRLVEKLKETDALLREISKPMPAEMMLKNAEKLQNLAEDLPESEFLRVYAKRKTADAAELAKLEKDRMYVWCWMDALDLNEQGGKDDTAAIAALIAAGDPQGNSCDLVQDLMNRGMFDVPEGNRIEMNNEKVTE